jgi:hypothetical protein
MSAFPLRCTILSLLLTPMLVTAQPPAPPKFGVGAPPAVVVPAPATPVVAVPVVVYNPYRAVVYPWVATSHHCSYWWQYPWYASPWWGYPWWTHWYRPYWPTPWGYWWLPPQYATYEPWPMPGYFPYARTLVQVGHRAESVVEHRPVESVYRDGYNRYWQGDYDGARKALIAAVERDRNDTAAWYFKALAERELGHMTAANESAQRGAALEMVNGRGPLLSLALERVQGETRFFLRRAGADLTLAKAQEIAAAPVHVATAK